MFRVRNKNIYLNRGDAITLQLVNNEGKFEAEYTCFKNCLDRGKTYEEAQILSGASDENAEKYHQKWLKENKRN